MTGIKHDEGKVDYSLVDFSVIYGEEWGRILASPNPSLLESVSSRWAVEFCIRMELLSHSSEAPGTGVDHAQLWAISQFVAVMNEGAKKYSANGWQLVRPISRYYSALIRHDMAAKLAGAIDSINDDDFGLPHLAHSMWNCYALAWFDRAGVK